ncbi:GNAT family N-acetyltransferase [Paenibacillus chitinolyticus]|uniref:GNAT family N-acetyltransferase n=1 Tax=Paenibacillus chitinolyticus TaxID=79263 RepID=UPI003D00AFA5
MAQLPVLTKELVKRLEKAETAFWTSRIEAIGSREGNPMGVHTARFGHTSAVCTEGMPWPLFNTVRGLGPEDIGELGAILRFYAEYGRSCTFELTPGIADKSVAYALARQGFYQENFHAYMYGLPEPIAPVLPPHIRIEPVTSADRFDLYAELHCVGTGMDVSAKRHFMDNNIVLLNRPGWHLYMGYVNDQPAGVSMMHIDGDIASFTLAATLPQHRSRGLHTAMLQVRMHEAAKRGCRLAAAQAAFGSVSQHNMERAGMRLAYTRAVWSALGE